LDHRALEFGEDAHHLKERPAARGRGVHALSIEVEVHPLGLQLGEQGEQVLK
jgi:hypothetical protein